MSIDEQMREEELAGATKALTTEAPAEGVHRGAYTYLGIFIRDLCRYVTEPIFGSVLIFLEYVRWNNSDT